MSIQVPSPEDGIVAIVEFDLERYLAGAVLRSTSPAPSRPLTSKPAWTSCGSVWACWPARDRTCSPSSLRTTASMRTRFPSTARPPVTAIADWMSG